MFGLGPTELVLVFLAVLLLFGAKRIPEIAQGLGKGIKEFRKSVKEATDEVKGSIEDSQVKSDHPTDTKPPKSGNKN